MSHLRWTPLILLLLGGVLLAEVQSPATRPAKPVEGYRMLGGGSWITSQATVRTTPGFPAQVKRKVTITTQPAGQRAIEEATWCGHSYETNGPAQALAPADGRSFDEMGLVPSQTQGDQAMIVARRRCVCSVTTYTFEDKGRRETTRLTLYRDKSPEARLPDRMMSVGGRMIPLPGDAVAADFETQGPGVSIKGQRRILFLDAPLVVGDRTCLCVVETVRSSGTRSDKPVSSQAREWHCHELPGEKLKSVSTANLGTVKVETDMTVTDFRVNPLAAAKGPATRPTAE